MAPEIRYKGMIAVYQALKARGRTDFMLLDEALEIVDQIDSQNTWMTALSSVALLFAEAEDTKTADQLIRRMPPEREHLKAMVAFAEIVARTNAGWSDDLLRKVNESVETLKSAWEKNQVLRACVSALRRLGKFDVAAEVVKRISMGTDLVPALLSLADAFAKAGDSRVDSTLTDALAAARSAPDAKSRSEYLSDVGAALAQVNDNRATSVLLEASHTLDDIPNKPAQYHAAKAHALALIRAGRYDASVEQIRYILNDDRHSDSMTYVLVELAKAGYAGQAEALALDFQVNWQISSAQSKLVAVYIDTGRTAEAIDLAHRIASEVYRAKALSKAAADLAQRRDERAASLFEESVSIAQRLPDNQEQVYALETLVHTLAKIGAFEKAKLLLRQSVIEDKSYGSLGLAVELAQKGFGQEAEATARTSPNILWRALALADLAKVAQKTDSERADSLFAESMQLVNNLPSEDNPSLGVRRVALILSQCGRFDEAERMARSIKAVEWKTIALSDMAGELAAVDPQRAEALFTEVSSLVQGIVSPYDQADALTSLMEALAKAGRYEWAEETARRITEEWSQVEALSKLGLILAQSGSPLSEPIFAEAGDRALEVLPEGLGYYVRFTVAGNLAKAQQPVNAFSILGTRPLDEYVRFVADCVSAFETAPTGVSSKILAEVARITGWIRPDWFEVSTILKPSESN